MNNKKLGINLSDLKLKNPIITASGTFGFGRELEDYFSPEILGAITLKGLTRKKSSGNEMPRIAETPAGILNSIGLENPGIDNFCKDVIPEIKKIKTPLIANISGHSIEDFAYLAEKLKNKDAISALEVNVSCPNLNKGGMVFGTDSELIYKITKKVKSIYPGDIIIKLTPNVTDITEMAEAAESAGANIISLINTLLGMAIDIEKRKPVLGNTFGGLSGPAIKPVALRMVYEVYETVDIPIIGMGGIMKSEDIIEFMLAGATAVGVGTATLVDPESTVKMINDLNNFIKKNNINGIKSIIGNAHN